MKTRILLKEIPAGKFHSVIFTTYSLNLYYLEQQVLPMLHSKGVHYVSVLTDSNRLSAQLETYSFLSEARKRNYALNGIQCGGAFHPKIIFLAGETSLLLLVGSGNLTSSGHGKNLEVWNPIYINSDADPRLGFAIQAWNYLKELHVDLGAAAQEKLKSIEENCSLLANTDKVVISDTYPIDAHSSISFLVKKEGVSLYQQLSALIGEEPITRISVMSPYYDSKGSLLHQLNERFKPEVINVLLQENFGAPPFNMAAADNMRFYSWSNTRPEQVKQDYFHAKNIVFEGKNQSFLLSGSANASVAAFGSDSFNMVNEEACILYQSTRIDFLELLALDLSGDTVELKDIETPIASSDDISTGTPHSVFIKTAEKSYDHVSIYLNSTKELLSSTICFYGIEGSVLFEEEIDIKKGISDFQIERQSKTSLLYCQVYNKKSIISNKQFVIDIDSFEGTNPSPQNRSLNQVRKLIENGHFSSTKIIGYLNTIYKQKGQKKDKISAKSQEDTAKDELIKENNSDLIYLSYEEIQDKAKHIDNSIGSKAYVEHKSVRLWESIFSYLKDSQEKKEQAKANDEETENINTSTGRAEKVKLKKAVSEKTYIALKKKVEKYLISYQKVLESKIGNKASEKPNLIDLSMFLVILEILLHLLSHKEKITDLDKELPLLQIPFSNKSYSWSELVIHLIGLFTLWCTQKRGFKESEGYEYNHKLTLYKKMAFETSVSAIALFSAVNKGYSSQKIEIWRNLCLLNVNAAFNDSGSNYQDTEAFNLYVPQETMEAIGEANFSDETNDSLQVINIGANSTSYYHHPIDGYGYIEKEIINPKDNSLKYLKLFNTGYGLDEKLHNFWNGKVYSINESKWIKSRMD